MKINQKLLPIKMHFFFFMAAMGPILPQVQVYGKELGISSVVMGTITGILPFTFLLLKPLFGLLVDVYRNYRKTIFIILIVAMTAFFAAIYLIPIDSAKECDDSACENINDFYRSFTFWSFTILMSLGTMGFNVINSITDAICFDVVGDEHDYGKQRVWGTIGFGLSALISGYLVDVTNSYAPAFIAMGICSVLDLFACFKLKLPLILPPANIMQDLKQIFRQKSVVFFCVFAIAAGIADSVIVYYLFWHLEDFAVETGTTNTKLLEGLIIAAETLGGEVVFFSIAGKIIKYLGHVNCFSICFFNYSIRFLLISLAPSPWWILPIEFFMQGPTYALTYTTIVAYANDLAPSGTSATMQGIAAGMSEGTGYALGSILGGIAYRWFQGQFTFKIFSLFALCCSCLHLFFGRKFIMPASDYEIL